MKYNFKIIIIMIDIFDQKLHPRSAIFGGSGPHGIQNSRPININRKPPHTITFLSANLKKKKV